MVVAEWDEGRGNKQKKKQTKKQKKIPISYCLLILIKQTEFIKFYAYAC